MSTTSEKVRKLVLPVVEALTQAPSVVGILCFGSYALEVYDEHSDIDLYVLCDPEMMPEAVRRTLLSNIQGVTDLQLHQTHAGWTNQWTPQSDRLLLNRMPIELSYNTKNWVTTVVRQVIEDGALSLPEFTFRPYTLLGLLANAIVLYDPVGVIAQLLARLIPYSAPLKANLIRKNLPILTEWLVDLHDCAMRDFGSSSFLFYLWHICDALDTLLFAINETYDPAAKRSEHELSKLPLLPNHFIVRYKKLLEGPFTPAGQRQAAAELTDLVTETIQLIPAPERKRYATATSHLS
jgi:predicted nucleotidyltransferase